MTFRKRVPVSRAVEWEAAGLRWLTVPGGAQTVSVLDVGTDHLDLERLTPVTPTASDAEEFGRALAVTHAAGAPAFGVGPDGWVGHGFQGPTDDLMPIALAPCPTWGRMYAELRILPLLAQAVDLGELTSHDVVSTEKLCAALVSGDHDTGDPPARLHGDLWSGNVMWTSKGGVLIDPAARAGHREVDLASLALFGCPHLDRIVAAYDEAAPLADGWQGRVPLMQLHLVLMHVVLFGGGYVEQARRIVDRYV